MLSSKQFEIDIEKLLTYPLGPIPCGMATGDGLPVKTNKSVLMDKLEHKLSTISQDLSSLLYQIILSILLMAMYLFTQFRLYLTRLVNLRKRYSLCCLK